MNLFRYILPLCVGCLLSASLQSCSDDSSPSLPSDIDNYIDVNIDFLFEAFGDSDFGTREDEALAKKKDPIDTDYDEGKLESLYLLVFKQDEDDVNIFVNSYFNEIKRLDPINGSLESEYPNKHHTLHLEEGKYKLYIVANLTEYWKNGQTGKTDIDFETEIKRQNGLGIERMILSFNNITILPSVLPMVCLPQNVAEYDTTGDNPVYNPLPNGILTITKEQITAFQSNSAKRISLTAPLSILCAKVRYTVLFDNTEGDPEEHFSQAFPIADIHFTEVTDGKGAKSDDVPFINLFRYTNIDPNNPVFPTFKDTDWSKKDFTIHQVEYPDKSSVAQSSGAESVIGDESSSVLSASGRGTAGYFNIENAEKSPANLKQLNTQDSWTTPTQRAWQGIAYIPENDHSYTQTEDKKTSFTLKGTGTGLTKEPIIITMDEEVKRGNFYDIVIKVKNSDTYKVELKVKVNPWIYNPSGPVDW